MLVTIFDDLWPMFAFISNLRSFNLRNFSRRNFVLPVFAIRISLQSLKDFLFDPAVFFAAPAADTVAV